MQHKLFGPMLSPKYDIKYIEIRLGHSQAGNVDFPNGSIQPFSSAVVRLQDIVWGNHTLSLRLLN